MMELDGMLTGLRVLDSTTAVAMPTAMHILADMGAEVIKVEAPAREESAARDDAFQYLQHGKLGVTVNVKAEGGLDLYKDLVRVSDVLVENNRAGTIARLGLGYDELRKVNPTIVMLSNTGFGQTGPWRRYTGIGSFLELTTGVSHFTGYLDQGPRQIGGAWIDIHAAWMTVFSVLAALYHRAQTGVGQHVDFAMYQVGVATMGVELLDYFSNGRIGEQMANRHPYHAPHGLYPCKGEDRWIAIAVESDAQWKSLCTLMDKPGLANDPRYADGLSRWHHQDDLDPVIAAWSKEYDYRELVKLTQDNGIVASIVPDAAELMTDTHMVDRGFYEKMAHSPESGYGTRLFIGRPWKASHTPSHFRRPAPYLGEHNEYVFGEILGLYPKDLERLYETGVAAKIPPKPRQEGAGQPGGRRGNIGYSAPSVENGTLAYIDHDYQKKLGIE